MWAVGDRAISGEIKEKSFKASPGFGTRLLASAFFRLLFFVAGESCYFVIAINSTTEHTPNFSSILAR